MLYTGGMANPHLMTRAEPEFVDRFRKAAEADGRTMSNALRLAAARWLAEREATSAPGTAA